MQFIDCFIISVYILLYVSITSADQRCPGVPDGGFCPYDPARLDAIVCCDLGFGPHCCNSTEFEQINNVKFYVLWGSVGLGLLAGFVLVPICVVLMHFAIQKCPNICARGSKNRRAHKSSVMPPRRPEPLEERLYGPADDDDPVESSEYSQAIASKTSPFYRKYSELTDKIHTIETDLPSASTGNDIAHSNLFYDTQLEKEEADLLDKQRMLWRKSSFSEGGPSKLALPPK
ncbi:hypothetical protein LOD99_14104 [Oopsacas minuta]|uniref:Uncharacterized protein n=1 Tax=Oopsacas minuta TaxID=111878 RepID=A0AAV7KII4_9METZ|nr:hypothetical protein LOD99_14104 [Oopsacas minuta]